MAFGEAPGVCPEVGSGLASTLALPVWILPMSLGVCCQGMEVLSETQECFFAAGLMVSLGLMPDC